MAFSPWLSLPIVLVVVYFLGLIPPIGGMLAFLCNLVAKPLLRFETLLEVFKEKLMSSDSKYIGLHTLSCLVAFLFAAIVLTADASNSFYALTALYGSGVSIPAMPAVFNLAMGALFLACPALLGMCWLEVKEVVPVEARIFTLLHEKSRGWFDRFVTIGLWLAIPDCVLYYALKPLFLANPDSSLVAFLQFAINVILGLVLPLVSILSLYILAIGLQTVFALVLAVVWVGVSACVDVLHFLSKFFLDRSHAITGIRPVETVGDAQPAQPSPMLQKAPTIAALPGYAGPPIEEMVLDAIPVSLKTARFPGRSREHFPIQGDASFVALINRILDELNEKAPDYYEQVLEYLPAVAHDISILPNIGRSDGLFTFSENTPYHFARFVLMHECGHNVYILQHGDDSEAMANDYAAKAVAKIESFEAQHDNT